MNAELHGNAKGAPSAVNVGGMLGASFVGTGRMPASSESGQCVVFRRVFVVDQAPVKANINIFANSRYLLWINGRYVERGPGRFEPKAPEYDTVDIAPFLQSGPNAVAVMVTGPVSNGRVQWHPLALTAQLTIGKGVIHTDSAWKWSDNTRYRSVAVNWANIYDIADARDEDGDWKQAAYDDSKWRSAVPTETNASPIHAQTQVDDRLVNLSIQPIVDSHGRASWWGPLTSRRIPLLRESVVQPVWQASFPKELRAGESLGFRFHHLVLAYTRIEVDAEAGTELEFTYSHLTRYVCRSGPQEFVTSDTHSIFDGAIRVKSGRATIRSVVFVERLYPFVRAGSFHSSDPMLNKLWTTCVRGLEVTSEDAYIDCTDRERVEWMDCDPPTFDVTRVAMAGPSPNGTPVYADPRLLEEMLRRTAYSIQQDGWVKAHTSSDRFDIHAKMEDRACDWVQGARRYYESCGKKAVIREIWPMIVRQMDYFAARRTERGLVNAREWVVWGNPVGYQTCEGTALNAFMYRAMLDAAFLGRTIGQNSEAERFERIGKSIGAAINTVLWDEHSGTYYGGYYDLETAKKAVDYRPLLTPVTDHLIAPTRHAALFALDQGLVPENRHGRVVRYLLANRPTDNSIMQYYYFFKQQYLLDNPHEDLEVLRTLRREWLDMAESPYEATFEGLHSWGSQAHCYGMFPAYFLSSYVLGVRLDGPVQNKTLLIEPRLADLTKASGVVVTEFGLIKVAWTKGSDRWTFRISSPPKIKLRLRLPTSASAAEVVIDGKSKAPVQVTGRWAEFEIGPGDHAGAFSGS